MKRKLLLQIIVGFMFISGIITAQEWRHINQQSLETINDMSYLGVDGIWVTGKNGSLLKSENGGTDWQEYETGLTKEISKIFFIDKNIGFAAVDTFLVRTVDAGENWDTLKLPTASPKIKTMYFSDSQKGWVLTGTSSSAKILSTTDAGANWTVFSITGNIEDMDFSGGRGIAVGGGVGKMELYYTADGATWVKAPVPANMPQDIPYTRLDLKTVTMVNDKVAYGTGWGSRAAGLQATILVKTTDGGETWNFQVQEESNRTYVNMYSMYFKDELNGIAVGGFSSYEGSVILKTTDGGTTWIQVEAPFGNSLNVIGGQGDNLFAGGGNGLLVGSSDLGSSWSLLTKMPGSTLYKSVFPTATNKVIYAAGSDGLFVKSEDQGKSWSAKYVYSNGVSPHIKDIHFVNDKVGYAVRNNRLVSKTTDGGETWTVAMQDTATSLFANEGVFFFDENIGFVVGYAGSNTDAIYKTTDGGQNWSSQIGQFGKKLNAVTFIDNNSGIVVGADTTIAYTNDGGATWTKSIINNVAPDKPAFNDVAFLNDTVAVAVGNKYVLRSINKGLSWDTVKVEGLDKSLESVSIKNQDTGYAVASSYLYLITDKGKTWQNITNASIADAGFSYGVAVDPKGYPWVTGSGSNIFTLATLDTVVVDPTSVEDLSKPVAYNLAQNFPNPFNPTTTIEYSLSNSGFVTLKVYNVLGKLIQTLVNEEKKAGTHKITFNASHLSSGMYIYTININGKTITKKMTLLK